MIGFRHFFDANFDALRKTLEIPRHFHLFATASGLLDVTHQQNKRPIVAKRGEA